MGVEEDRQFWFATRARLLPVVDAGPDRKRSIRRDRASTRSAARAWRLMVPAYTNGLPLACVANRQLIGAGLLACSGQAAGSKAIGGDLGRRRRWLFRAHGTRRRSHLRRVRASKARIDRAQPCPPRRATYQDDG